MSDTTSTKNSKKQALKSLDLEKLLRVRSGVRAGRDALQFHGSDFNAAKNANTGEG